MLRNGPWYITNLFLVTNVIFLESNTKKYVFNALIKYNIFFIALIDSTFKFSFQLYSIKSLQIYAVGKIKDLRFTIFTKKKIFHFEKC